ncbi:MAG: dihydroorotase, partial [Candidatus Aenigmarchaeota archaeon]|nr:dihydroorotase [Candidatus Aenigmarchaeota archaeon]
DGTIDVIASDYAPLPQPKKTGIAGFRSFLPLSYGLVIQGILTGKQLKEKLYLNPKRIIRLAGGKLI